MAHRRLRAQWIFALWSASALFSCRSPNHGVALSIVAWASSDGMPVLAQACHLDPGLLDGTRSAMPLYVRVLHVSVDRENLAHARVRLQVRQSVAPQPVQLSTYDLQVTAQVRRIDPATSTTPHLPLPTYAGWSLQDVTAANCAPATGGVRSFIEELFGET